MKKVEDKFNKDKIIFTVLTKEQVEKDRSNVYKYVL